MHTVYAIYAAAGSLAFAGLLTGIIVGYRLGWDERGRYERKAKRGE